MAQSRMTGRRPRVPMTPELLADMVELLSTAKSFREISRKVGLPLASVRLHLAPFVAIMKMQGAALPSMKKPHRPPITAKQVEELAERLTTATSLRQIAREMDLDKQTVAARARPIIAQMREDGTLGLCVCGKERFHPYICRANSTNPGGRWQTPEHIEKRASIVSAILAGRTYESIGREWGIVRKGVMAYRRHLTPQQIERRKALERGRVRAKKERQTFRPFRDDVYSTIAAAVPRHLSEATRDDAISDLYIAVLEGRVPLKDIGNEAKIFAARALAAYESKFGPRSLDEDMFDDGGATYLDRIECPSALVAFDEIRFAREEIPCL